MLKLEEKENVKPHGFPVNMMIAILMSEHKSKKSEAYSKEMLS